MGRTCAPVPHRLAADPVAKFLRKISALRSDIATRISRITASRMIPGLVVKDQKGALSVLREGQQTALSISGRFLLTDPSTSCLGQIEPASTM
jgi:hypothetical protein